MTMIAYGRTLPSDLHPGGRAPTANARAGAAIAAPGVKTRERARLPQPWSPIDPNAPVLAEQLARICEKAGLLLDIQLGPQAWIEAISEQGGWLNPTFDPDCSDLDESDSGSVVIRDEEGRFLACNAVRLFETETFSSLIQSGGLFHRPGHRNRTALQTILPEGYDLSGRISYSGGTLVDPAMRGRRLALLTTRLVRLMGERFFRADWHTGTIFHTRTSELPPKPYGFQRVIPCLDALTIPERTQRQTLFLVELSRMEFRRQLADNVARLAADGRQNLDDLALLV
ncbi:hypothetical protein [Algihabitans albus]|uniref:hypothetical protein n=1 Tax=Algihabitans albus TaxID=2164067 RepID=UPI0013C32A54|nr:hypothetical protein [Algihabitans albus]